MIVSKYHCDNCRKRIKDSYESITIKCFTIIDESRNSRFTYNAERDFCSIKCLGLYIASIRAPGKGEKVT